jgi:tetratricopeptide (TPR) repeat protein
MKPGALAAALLVATALAAAAPRADAQGPGATQTPPPTPQAVARARQHYATGKTLYLQGRYREALSEMETAHALDPTAVPLVYNISVIHERLGEIDEAIRWLRVYLTMRIAPAERDKAETNLRRLEGAKAELAQHAAVGTAPTQPQPAPPPPSGDDSLHAPADDATEQPTAPAGGDRSSSWGRVDAATVLTGVLAVTAFGVGVFFGVKALSDRPNGFVGGVNGSYSDFQQRNDAAHREAIAADVAIGVGVVATAAAAWLFFSRAPDPRRAAALSFAPRSGGGELVVGGSF